jgi:hypothetical protein
LFRLAPDDPLALIATDLRAVERAPDDGVRAVDAALTRFLPDELNKLRTALTAEPATLASVPPDIARDWVLADGRARVQALPVADARNSEGLHRFVDEVRRIVPEAGGTAVTVVATSDTIVQAFKSAALAAVAFSALTTGTAFGSLALSAHPGTASMGALLLISLGCTLLATLLFVPALLTALSPPHVREARVAAARTAVVQRAR